MKHPFGRFVWGKTNRAAPHVPPVVLPPVYIRFRRSDWICGWLVGALARQGRRGQGGGVLHVSSIINKLRVEDGKVGRKK